MDFLAELAASGPGEPGTVGVVDPLRDLASGRCPELRKVRYPTEEAVDLALEQARTWGPNPQQGWHWCPSCDGYHLRNRPGKRARPSGSPEDRQRAQRRTEKNRAKKKRKKANARARKRARLHAELAALMRARVEQMRAAQGASEQRPIAQTEGQPHA